MLKVDVEIMNYIEKIVKKGTNVKFEKIYSEEFETPLIQVTIFNSRIKEIIHYDYEHVKRLDDIRTNLDSQISYFNSRICKISLN